MPITRGSTPATALPNEAPQRLRAELARLLLARDHERCGAVVEPARVSGGDGSVLSERRLQRRKLSGSCPGADARPDEPSYRHELVGEAPAGRPAQRRCERRRTRPGPRARRPALGDVLARLAHRLEREHRLEPRVGEAPAERRVVDIVRSPRGNAVSGFAIDEWRPAHRLDAAGDEEVAVARAIACAAPTTAERPEAQRRLSVTPATESGNPARARPCAPRCGCPRPPGWRSRGRRPRSARVNARALDRGAAIAVAARSSGRTPRARRRSGRRASGHAEMTTARGALAPGKSTRTGSGKAPSSSRGGAAR